MTTNSKFSLKTYLAALVFLSSPAFYGNAHAAPPAESFTQLPGIRDAAISPDGKVLASVSENNDEYIIRIYNLENLADTKIVATGLGAGQFPVWINWANNERLLINVEQTVKYNNDVPVKTRSLITASRDLKDTAVLIKQGRTKKIGSNLGTNAAPRQFNDYVIDWLPDDPEHILMGFSDDDRFETDIQKVNVATGRYTKFRPGSLNTQRWITDSRGEARVGMGRVDRNGEYFLTIRDANSEAWNGPEAYPGLKADEDILGFTENPNEMIVSRYEGANTLGVFIYDLDQKRISRKLFQHPQYDVSRILRSPDEKRVIGVEFEADQTQVEFFDAEAKAHLDKIKALATGYQIRYIDRTPDGQKTVVFANAADAPGNILVHDNKANTLEFIGSTHPKLAKATMAYVQPVTYTARDGEKIPGFVTLPHKAVDANNIKNLPYIIFPHGGPFARDSAAFDNLAQLMASRGYGVLQMNFRGSTGYGKRFSNAGRDNWVVMQEDVEDGTRWLIEKGYADPGRICIMGWSYGGYAALMGAVKSPDLYKCAASIAGVTDLQNLMTDMRKYRFGNYALRDFVLRGFDERRDLSENSPWKRAAEIKIPVFLAHGENDVRVHYDQFTRMKSALEAAKADVTAIGVEAGDHSLLTNGKGRKKALGALDDFMRRNLGKSEWED